MSTQHHFIPEAPPVEGIPTVKQTLSSEITKKYFLHPILAQHDAKMMKGHENHEKKQEFKTLLAWLNKTPGSTFVREGETPQQAMSRAADILKNLDVDWVFGHKKVTSNDWKRNPLIARQINIGSEENPKNINLLQTIELVLRKRGKIPAVIRAHREHKEHKRKWDSYLFGGNEITEPPGKMVTDTQTEFGLDRERKRQKVSSLLSKINQH